MILKQSFARLARQMSGPSRQEREMAYLNASYSLVDLERRQREIDQGKFR